MLPIVESIRTGRRARQVGQVGLWIFFASAFLAPAAANAGLLLVAIAFPFVVTDWRALFSGTALLGLVLLRRRWWAGSPVRILLWVVCLLLLLQGFLITQARGSWFSLVVAAGFAFLLSALVFLLLWSLFNYRVVHQDWRFYWLLLAGTIFSFSLPAANVADAGNTAAGENG